MKDNVLLGTPTLTTRRLTLDRISTDDAESFFEALMKDVEVGKYMLEYSAPTAQKAREYIDNIIDLSSDAAYNYWAIRNEDRFIGTISLFSSFEHRRGSVAYQLVRDIWGKGHATEALREVMRFAFLRLGLHRLEAECFAENRASARVLEKCGFQIESTARDKVLKDDRFHDVNTYTCFYSV